MPATEIFLPVRDYDLATTLDSGQVFRWQPDGKSWVGVLGQYALSLTQTNDGIHAEAAVPVADWSFLRQFLQTDLNLASVLQTFPDDEPMRAAVNQCRGLRLLRQDPWECLASFILSSTKQIVQIRQIVGLLCEQFGEPIKVGRAVLCPPPIINEHVSTRATGAHGVTRPAIAFAFPTPLRLAVCSETELRACKMGFRAKALLGAARAVVDGQLDLESIRTLDYDNAQAELMKMHGVGKKIADCVLLFAYGFDSAFPVDVWVERALQELYFSRRRANHKRLLKFTSTHFGPHAGYAQQYLFHYIRTRRM